MEKVGFSGIARRLRPQKKKSWTKICEDFEFRAVKRCGNLVDLEKRCKMSIWAQKSALIQLRTSFLKFWLENLRNVRGFELVI